METNKWSDWWGDTCLPMEHFTGHHIYGENVPPLNEAEVVNLSSARQFWLNKLHSITREDHNVHHHKEHLWARLFSKTYVELAEISNSINPPPPHTQNMGDRKRGFGKQKP